MRGKRIVVRILVTRPEPDNARTAAALRARGHTPVLAPLLRVEPVAAEIGPGPFAAVLITSANAVRALTAHPARARVMALPAFVVGDATAAVARDAGFASVEAAEGDAASLVRLVRARCGAASAPLLYLAGADRAADLGAALAQDGIAVTLAVVYRALLQPLASDARAELAAGRIDRVLHYSRRSARHYLAAATEAGLRPQALRPAHHCLAEPVAAVLREAGAATVMVAAEPDEAHLLSLLN